MTEYDVQKFEISIPEADLADMNERLRRTRFPQDFANDDWRYGYNTAYHKQMVDYWINEYDWRDVERRMNELPHYKVDLMGVPLHFIHVKGTRAEGAPAPDAAADPPRLAVDVLGPAQGDRPADRPGRPRR